MQALNDPEPEPLSLLAESDGLLPHAVRARVTAATLVSTAPVRFRCTDFILSSSGPAPAGGPALRSPCRFRTRVRGSGDGSHGHVAARRPGRPSQDARPAVHY